MIKLRPYQIDSIEEIRTQLRLGHSRIVLQLPTGAGKTVIFSYMVKQASERGRECLILTDRTELLEQAGGTFEKVEVNYQNITARSKSVPNSPVNVAMIETMKRRAKKRLDFTMYLKRVDLIVIDECHKHTFDGIFEYISEECIVIGVTATPIRLTKKHPLSDYFTSLVTGVSIGYLIDEGFLSKPEYFGVPVDLSSVKMKRGEFDERDLESVYKDATLFEGLRYNMNLHAKNKKTMIFCPSVKSSLEVARELDCLHVDGTMSPADRKAVLNKFETTPGATLSNVGITTTGYDCPGIECIILYRATTSLPLYLQMIGRGSRTTETKRTFTILDFGMNVQRFGYWHDDREWSLDNKPQSRKKREDTFPVKFCPGCGAIMSVNVKICSYCGYVWPITERERIFAELERLTFGEIQKRVKEAKTIQEKEEIRIAKGYKIGWLLHSFKTTAEFHEYAKYKGYKNGWVKYQLKHYGINS